MLEAPKQEETLTPQPQDPNEILQALLDALKKQMDESKIQKEEIEALKKIVAEDLPKQFNAQFLEMAQKTQETFVQIGSILDKVQSNSQLAAAPQQQQRGGGIMETVLNLIDNATKAFNANPATTGGDVVTAEISQMVRDNFKTQLQIMRLQSQTALKASAKAAGLVVDVVPEHIQVLG